MKRRSFLAALAALAATDATAQRPEVETYWAEVPSRATLWGHAVFLSDKPVELTVAAGKTIQKMRGRFGGERMKEYSWRNASDTQQRVGIRAVALAGDRELPAGPVHYTLRTTSMWRSDNAGRPRAMQIVAAAIRPKRFLSASLFSMNEAWLCQPDITKPNLHSSG